MSTKENELPDQGFLESLTNEEREILRELGEELTFSEGETVIQEAASQDHLYVLLNGRCKVLQKHVAPTVTAWLEEGESFGEVNLFDLEGAGASASVRAAVSIVVWRIDRNGLNTFIGSHPDASLRLTIGLSTLLSKRLRSVNELVKEMSVWTRA